MAYTKEDWWKVDGEGRRIGWMWPEDFEVILESVYGPRVWVEAFGEEFGVARATMGRWRSGSAPIPKTIAQLVNMLSVQKQTKVKRKRIEADWLPNVGGTNGRRIGAADAAT